AWLAERLSRERDVWGRVLIVDALGAAKTEGARPIVLGALFDDAWPVRAAAFSALQALEARDAEVIEALLAALERETGRLRMDARNTLSAVTGQAFGIDPAAWRAWWGAARDGWTPPAAPAPVARVPADGLSRCFGVLTASKRVAFLVSRSQTMAEPIKRRATGNDGEPSPEPAVDTALRIAAWELEEAIAALPEDAEFTVLVYGEELEPWSKNLKRWSAGAASKVARFLSRFEPDGYSRHGAALEWALAREQPRGLDDLAFGTPEGVDTIFLVGDTYGVADLTGARDGLPAALTRIARFRRVVVRTITVKSGGSVLRGVASATGGGTRYLGSLSEE
ncbi:MAG: HEAT repeat domain-containing protein, partial [Planctomycetota bacterium]